MRQNTPEEIEKAVERLAKALWVKDQKDFKWALEVVEDVFYPTDDLPEEAFAYYSEAKALLSLPEVPEGEYDRATAALAPYLPDGWVAAQEDNSLTWFSSEPYYESKYFFGWKYKDGSFGEKVFLKMPFSESTTSLRRIEKGRVVQ